MGSYFHRLLGNPQNSRKLNPVKISCHMVHHETNDNESVHYIYCQFHPVPTSVCPHRPAWSHQYSETKQNVSYFRSYSVTRPTVRHALP